MPDANQGLYQQGLMSAASDPGYQGIVTRAGGEVTGGVTGVPSLIDALTATVALTYGVVIAPELVAQFTLDTPIFNRVMQMTPNPVVTPERAALYGVFTGANFTGGSRGSFPIGGDPPGITYTRQLSSAVKRSYGASGGVKDVDVIASTTPGAPNVYMGERFQNEAELLLRLLTLKTLTALDFGTIRGNNGTYPTEFNGIETNMTVDATAHPFVVDMTGSAYLPAMLNNMVISMMSYGIQPSEIWCHPIMKQAIINAYLANNQVRLNVELGNNNMVLGQWADSIVTPAGTLPIVTSRKFTLGGTGANLSGDIFIITRAHDGVSLMYYDWQVMPTALNLARVPGYYTSQVYGVWSHLVLIERTNYWAQGRLMNVGIPYSPTFGFQGVTP